MASPKHDGSSDETSQSSPFSKLENEKTASRLQRKPALMVFYAKWTRC